VKCGCSYDCDVVIVKGRVLGWWKVSRVRQEEGGLLNDESGTG
jgi:hypothetical protein